MELPADASPALRTVIECEEALNQAMVKQDVDTIRRLMSEKLVYVHSTATSETKAEYLTRYNKGVYGYASMDSTLLSAQMYDDAVAVLTGTHETRVGPRGAPTGLIHTRFVMIWANEAGEWRLVYRQATKIPEK